MKVLITGGNGMLGRTVRRVLKDRYEFVVADLPEVDILDEEGFLGFVASVRPDVVVHCAAATKVDDCETNVDFAYRLNARGSANVASVCDRLGIRLVAISTDYVFDGGLDRPYTEFDVATGGATVYGKSKFAGEELIRTLCPDHVIMRISWLYGFGGPSFVHTMLDLADGTRSALAVVADQRGNPTSAIAVARKLDEFLSRPLVRGTFHVTCEGEASWAEFAAEIFRIAGVDQRIRPCSTAEFPRPAPRPKNSRLDKMALRISGFAPMPDWKVALREFMEQEFGETV